MVEVKSGGGSGSPPWVTGVIGALGTLVGASITFWLGMWRARRERQADRKLKSFDELVAAIEELDAAHVAVSVETPTAEANTALVAKQRKFDRKVKLVADKEIQRLAEDWSDKTKRYWVTQDTEDEAERAGSPTNEQVIEAQDLVFKRIRFVGRKTF